MHNRSTEASPVGDAGVALLVYTVVTGIFVALSHLRLTESYVGQGEDRFEVLWNAWWMKHAIQELRNPFFTDRLFYPFGTSLVLHSLDPLQTTAIAGLTLFLPVPLAYNLVMLSALVVAGMGAFALCRYVTGNQAASVVGGLVFMLCPFIVSRVDAGWTDMAYAGLLPIYFVCLLRATDSARRLSWRDQSLLAGCVVLLLLTGIPTCVFAANLSAVTLAWRALSSGQWKQAVIRFTRALLPAIVVAVPYVVMTAIHVSTYFGGIRSERRWDYMPEPLSYLLPFSFTSTYADLTHRLQLPASVMRQLSFTETSCYLGLLVLPLALWGFFAERRSPLVRLSAVVFVLFGVLSLGPVLLHYRAPVRVAGMIVYLPYRLWQELPVLGAVVQAGRYLSLSYMAMSVGVAAAVMNLRRRTDYVHVATTVCALVVCVDFAVWFNGSPMPPVPDFTSSTGAVLDPRMRSGLPMLYQTQHGRPLIGGYLSRPPRQVLAKYERYPEVARLLRSEPIDGAHASELLDQLAQLGVGAVVLAPNSSLADGLERAGLVHVFEDENSAIWNVPSSR